MLRCLQTTKFRWPHLQTDVDLCLVEFKFIFLLTTWTGSN